MKRFHSDAIAAAASVLLTLLSPRVLPLSTDKDQPIEVEADSAELDDVKNVSVYRGNVIVVQGSIRMTGDIMTVYYTEKDELQDLILDGKPATYRQMPDKGTIYDTAEAMHMEYHELKSLIVLTDNALVTQEGLRFSGDRIEYDTALSKVKAWSKPPAETAEQGTAPQDGGRVKIIIKKKKKEPPPAGN